MVAIKIGPPGDKFLVVNFYNPGRGKDPRRKGSGKTRQLLENACGKWVIGGDSNVYHPAWSAKEKDETPRRSWKFSGHYGGS
jgi:hypothetical protein